MKFWYFPVIKHKCCNFVQKIPFTFEPHKIYNQICSFFLRFSIQKSGGDAFSLLTVLIDDEPYWTTGELEISSSRSQCVGLELSLSVGQTVKVLNRLYSYVFIDDNGFDPSWFGGFAETIQT